MSETQFVIFKLASEAYGVEIMKVQEITDYKTPVTVPDSPEYISGVINLRGKIVPIIDLKKRLNIKSTDETIGDRIVIVNVKETQVGVLVDDASQVLTLASDQIEKAPHAIGRSGKNLISGIGKSDNEIILLVDFESLIQNEELSYLKEMKSEI